MCNKLITKKKRQQLQLEIENDITELKTGESINSIVKTMRY